MQSTVTCGNKDPGKAGEPGPARTENAVRKIPGNPAPLLVGMCLLIRDLSFAWESGSEHNTPFPAHSVATLGV